VKKRNEVNRSEVEGHALSVLHVGKLSSTTMHKAHGVWVGIVVLNVASILLACGARDSPPASAPARVVASPPLPKPPPPALDCATIPCGTRTFSTTIWTQGRSTLEETPVTCHEKFYTICVAITEVTVDAYDKCVVAGTCSEPDAYDANDAKKKYCNWKNSSRGNHPINCVDWDQASTYCSWVRGRLPTSNEWLWVAQAGDKGWKHPWGDDAQKDQLCWDGEGNSLGKGNRHSTCPVGSYPAGDNLWGVKDLEGNVSEWTYEAYANALVSINPSADDIRRLPIGPGWRSQGGSRSSPTYYSPRVRRDDVGFRCVQGALHIKDEGFCERDNVK
jgi:formylglycine-generating enzyme required for sulfatase activity